MKDYSRSELQAIRKHLIIPHWQEIVNVKVKTSKTEVDVMFFDITSTNWNNTSTYIYRQAYADLPPEQIYGFMEGEEKAFHQYASEQLTPITSSRAYVNPYTIRDPYLPTASLKELTKVVADILTPAKFQELYEECDIAGISARADESKRKQKAKNLEVRAQKMTRPGQRAVARVSVLLAINDALEKANLPFKMSYIEGSVTPSLALQIKFNGADKPETIPKISSFLRLEKETEIDSTGQELYDELVKITPDIDKLIKSLGLNKNSHCRQFSVMFGKDIVSAALDRNEIIRKAAKIKFEKVKTVIKLPEEKIDD